MLLVTKVYFELLVVILSPLKRNVNTGQGSATAAHTNMWELPWTRVVFIRGVTSSGGTAVQDDM